MHVCVRMCVRGDGVYTWWRCGRAGGEAAANRQCCAVSQRASPASLRSPDSPAVRVRFGVRPLTVR